LPVADLAAELMPAFGPDGAKSPGRGSGQMLNILQVMNWTMSSYPRSASYPRELEKPVREGLQALEQAGRIEKRVMQRGGQRMGPTRLGEEALASSSVREHLTPSGGS
jgi:hypothetical protein